MKRDPWIPSKVEPSARIGSGGVAIPEPLCEHCGKHLASKTCKSCGYRACVRCLGTFEAVDAFVGWELRCPRCGETAGWKYV